MVGEIIVGALSALGVEGVKGVGHGIGVRMSEREPISIEEVEVMRWPPFREGLSCCVRAEEVAAMSSPEFASEYLSAGWEDRVYIDCAEIRLRIRNTSKAAISLRGFGVDKTPIEDPPRSSFLFESQGGRFAGGRIAFAVNLDLNRPTVRQYELRNRMPEYYGDDYFFDTSTIELESQEATNLMFSFVAHERACEVGFTLRYDTPHRSNGIVRFFEDEKIRIAPLSMIPENARWCSAFSPVPPGVILESERYSANNRRSTRWDDGWPL